MASQLPDALIASIKLSQDIELANAFDQLKNNPAAYTQFLQNQNCAVYSNIVTQKEGIFQKVYGDLDRSTRVQGSTMQAGKSNKNLVAVQDQIYEQTKAEADNVIHDKNLATRKAEMNEWTVGNKQDTLFVFTALFIMLSGLILITVLWRMGLIGSGLWVGLGAPMIIVFVLIFIRRSMYTTNMRDKRWWNRTSFPEKQKKIAMPSCADLQAAATGAANALDTATATAG